MLFRSNIDRRMVNTGTKAKPFLFAGTETRDYFLGPIKYCSITVEKSMDNIGDSSRPYWVKAWEYLTVKVLGVKLRRREQFWNHDKL